MIPCSDGQWPSNDEYYKQRLDEVTRLLCFTLTNLSEGQRSVLFTISPEVDGTNGNELARWWWQHEEQDRARQAKEEADARLKEEKKKAIAKLSPKERRILGL